MHWWDTLQLVCRTAAVSNLRFVLMMCTFLLLYTAMEPRGMLF